jgi:hypothetical protein
VNAHIFYDRLTVKLAEITFKDFRYFADSFTEANPTSLNIVDHVRQTSLAVPGFSGEGCWEVEAHTPVGVLDPAFMVARWLGDSFPTLIYHHGNNERPFGFGLTSKNSFKNILLAALPAFPANLIAVRAPYHQDLRQYLRAARRVENFASMLAASVRLVEALVQELHARSSQPVLTAGLSLGGWVVNLHKTCFNTAEAYAPMLAGAALDDVFTSSAYRRLTSPQAAANPQAVMAVLNFEAAFQAQDFDNVFPLLARCDQIVAYQRQVQGYGSHPVRVLEKGHTTASLAPQELRQHLLEALTETARRHASPAPAGAG